MFNIPVLYYTPRKLFFKFQLNFVWLILMAAWQLYNYQLVIDNRYYNSMFVFLLLIISNKLCSVAWMDPSEKIFILFLYFFSYSVRCCLWSQYQLHKVPATNVTWHESFLILYFFCLSRGNYHIVGGHFIWNTNKQKLVKKTCGQIVPLWNTNFQ